MKHLFHALAGARARWRTSTPGERARLVALACMMVAAWLAALVARPFVVAWRRVRQAACAVAGHVDSVRGRLSWPSSRRARGVGAWRVDVRRACQRCGRVRHEVIGGAA